ncbi:MAG: hypothetical protein V1885_00865 [Candidatus Brennerbacteria bacterium]
MKHSAVVLFLSLIVATIGTAQRTAKASETVHRTVYEAEWDVAWYERILGGIAGLLPSQFELLATRWKSGNREEFFMELKDGNGKVWAQFHSDTAHYRSAVWIPRKLKKTLGPDVIRFIRECERLFKDDARNAFYGTFAFGGKPLAAHAFRIPYGMLPPDRTRFAVQAVDAAGKTEVSGTIEVSSNPHPFHYPFISVYLADDEVGITLKEAVQKQ